MYHYENKSQKRYIVIYCHPSTTNIDKLLVDFSSCLNEAASNNKTFYLAGNTNNKIDRPSRTKTANDYNCSVRRLAKILQWGEGLFWRLVTKSNDLDLNFDRSSIRLSRFLCPNIGDLQKKEEGASFCGQNHSGSWPILIADTNRGGTIFVLRAKIGLKSAKKRGYLHTLLADGVGYSTPPPPGYANVLSYNVIQLTALPTRVTSSSQNIINHILTNDVNHNITPFVILVRDDLSHHYVIGCCINDFSKLPWKKKQGLLVRDESAFNS